MKRTEFDERVREMKEKKINALHEIELLQSEIKEEIASKKRQVAESYREINKLNQSLQGCNQRFIRCCQGWNAKLNAFIRENESSTTSTLSDIPTESIVKELRERGYKGLIQHDEEGELYYIDKPEDE